MWTYVPASAAWVYPQGKSKATGADELMHAPKTTATLILARHSRVKNVFIAQQIIKNKFITVQCAVSLFRLLQVAD